MNKRGFTLIELLAVIIILAIIAVITIPAAINVIEDVQKIPILCYMMILKTLLKKI